MEPVSAAITNEIGVIEKVEDLDARLDAEMFVERDRPLHKRRYIVNRCAPPHISTDHSAVDDGTVCCGSRQTSFAVDGANDNDSWGRQTLFSSLPLAAVQEVTILTNAFSAEYGGSTGSEVNIITPTGGNTMRGQLIEV